MLAWLFKCNERFNIFEPEQEIYFKTKLKSIDSGVSYMMIITIIMIPGDLWVSRKDPFWSNQHFLS